MSITPGKWVVDGVVDALLFDPEAANLVLIRRDPPTSSGDDVAYAAYMSRDGDNKEQLANARAIAEVPKMIAEIRNHPCGICRLRPSEPYPAHFERCDTCYERRAILKRIEG